MEPAQNLIAPPSEFGFACAVAASGVIRANVDQLKGLRQAPSPIPNEPLPSSFLKHVDDQTVAGLAAVLQAIDRHGLNNEDFTEWGVVAAPRFLARATLAQALKRFALEGAWGVSPHLIPHRSLHSVSGTVSQALHIHGPNLGVGGGPHGASKAFLAAAALLADRNLPGLWIVLTGWNREPGLENAPAATTNGHAEHTPTCSAVALALAAASADWNGPELRVAPGSDAANGCGYSASLSLEGLVEAITGTHANRSWRLDCGGYVELDLEGSRDSQPTTRNSPLTTHHP